MPPYRRCSVCPGTYRCRARRRRSRGSYFPAHGGRQLLHGSRPCRASLPEASSRPSCPRSRRPARGVRGPTRLDADSEDLHRRRGAAALHGTSPPTTSLDLLYVTDRVPVTTPDGSFAYSSDRSRSMAFGSVTVDIGEQVPWPVLAQQSTESKRELALELRLGAVTELGRFPPIPYDVDPVPGGITRSSAT